MTGRSDATALRGAAVPAGGPRASRRGPLAVAAMVAAHVLLYQAICVLKYRYYLYRDLDLALFVQALGGLRHGSWFSSIRGMPWLGDHSSLLLIPLAPLFALLPHPLTLLAVQTLALGLGAVPLYLLARRELPPGPLPVALAAAYLLHPALGYLNLFEFHPETLAIPLLLACVLELRADRPRRALLWAGLAVLAREDVAAVVLGLAAVTAFAGRPRRPRVALGLALLAIASLAVTFGALRPLLLAGQASYARMYERWGRTPAEALRHALARPWDAVAALWSTPDDARDALAKRQYWALLLGPALGLPLLAPAWFAIALPILFEHMLSDRIYQHGIAHQYAALVLPVVWIATVRALRGVARRTPPAWTRALAALLVIAGLAAQMLWGPLVDTGSRQVVKRNEEIWPDSLERTLRPYRDRMLARVPRAGAVVAGFEFLPHLALRDSVHSLHHVLSGRYTYSDRAYPRPEGVRAVIGDMSGMIPYCDFESGARLRAVADENDLRPADAAGGTILMLPGARDPVEFFRVGASYEHPRLDLLADRQLLFLGAVRLDETVAPGQVTRIESYWERVAPANRTYLVQVWLLRDKRVALYGRARSICYGLFSVPEWPESTIVRETYHLLVPDDTPPGIYRPVFRLMSVDESGHQELPTVRVGNLTEPMNLVGLGEIRVSAGGPSR